MKRLVILFTEFFATKKENKIKFWRIFTSLIIGILCWFLIKKELCINIEETFYSILCNTLGILAGFTLSTIAILATSGNEDVLQAKEYIVREDSKYGKLSLFTSVTANLIVVLIFQVALLIINIIFPLFFTRDIIFMCVNITLIIDIILQLLSSILDLYFIITRNK